MATNVELYEALKPHVGEDAAGMIADVVAPARDLVTTSQLDVAIAGVHTRIAELDAHFSQRLLTYFIPLWVMMGSMALAIVGLVATRG